MRTLPDGTLDLEEVERKIRNGSDVHQSRTSVICLENTHNRCGGRILPVDWTLQVTTTNPVTTTTNNNSEPVNR